MHNCATQGESWHFVGRCVYLSNRKSLKMHARLRSEPVAINAWSSDTYTFARKILRSADTSPDCAATSLSREIINKGIQRTDADAQNIILVLIISDAHFGSISSTNDVYNNMSCCLNIQKIERKLRWTGFGH